LSLGPEKRVDGASARPADKLGKRREMPEPVVPVPYALLAEAVFREA